ncbi:hypothetical protein J6590_058523 [Homalodisca vitripennis]|nr:hypothetical protein J6590_058523 [Homalodisca vitripennis]
MTPGSSGKPVASQTRSCTKRKVLLTSRVAHTALSIDPSLNHASNFPIVVPVI